MRNLFRNTNPAILVIIALLLGNNLLSSNQSFGEWLYDQILFLPAIIVGLTFHEAAHGFASYWLGDPTPKLQGRLSLNPIKHIDPIGFLALFFAGFGWGKPVEINPMYYKNRRRDELIVSLAGVVTNFVIAIIACFAMKFSIDFMGSHGMNIVSYSVFMIFNYMMTINIVLMVFNLLPVPPLDGFGVITQIFNLKKYDWYYKVYSNGFLIIMFLIVFNITDKILTPAVGTIFNMLLNTIGAL
ncbi:MAG: site-2 protease family protein [Firmicutes bacterium]|nr:site-2 protease family protein [Bacillota bacterium]